MKIALAIGRGTDTIWRKEHPIASVANRDPTEAGMFFVNEWQIEMRNFASACAKVWVPASRFLGPGERLFAAGLCAVRLYELGGSRVDNGYDLSMAGDGWVVRQWKICSIATESKSDGNGVQTSKSANRFPAR